MAPGSVFAKGGHSKGIKGASEKAYEHANDKARFKRDEGWFQKIGQHKEKTGKEEKQLEKQLKKEEKAELKEQKEEMKEEKKADKLSEKLDKKTSKTMGKDKKGKK